MSPIGSQQKLICPTIDIDDRVRAICEAMDLVPVIWCAEKVVPDRERCTYYSPSSGPASAKSTLVSFSTTVSPKLDLADSESSCADTDDWRLSDTANPRSQEQILQNFNRFLGLADTLSTGFIVLAHDLYTVSRCARNPPVVEQFTDNLWILPSPAECRLHP